ncbi:SsrA-binding protein [Armatimonadota bacterium]|nr:SsrA-binding protein [Armatimonadota bacterium]
MMNKNEKALKSAAAEKQESKRQVAYNRRARFEYEIMDTYDAGLELAGTEVKSIREGRLNLQDAFCRIEHNEAWIHNMHISPYEQGNIFNVEPRRKRKLLLHRWQILELKAKTEQKGLTIVPLTVYFLRGFAKMEIALAKGKKLYDKRDSIAERDQQREQQRQFVRGDER